MLVPPHGVVWSVPRTAVALFSRVSHAAALTVKPCASSALRSVTTLMLSRNTLVPAALAWKAGSTAP